MYVSKREEMVLVVVFFLVIASMGFVGFYFSENSTPTGAVIGIGLDVENVSEPTLLDQIIANDSVEELIVENETDDLIENNLIIPLDENLNNPKQELPEVTLPPELKQPVVENVIVPEPSIEESQIKTDQLDETPSQEIILPTNAFKSQNFGIAGEATSSTCGNVSEDLTLTADIQSNNGVCFKINASGVTLDCNGFLVNHSKTGQGEGVYSLGHSNYTIKNCNFLEGSTSGFIQIYLQQGSNITFQNNTLVTVSSGSYAIALSTITNARFDSNNITCYDSNCIFPALSADLNFTNNNFTQAGAAYKAMIITPSDSLDVVENNNFYIYNNGGRGIREFQSANIIGNTFITNDSESYGIGGFSTGGDNFISENNFYINGTDSQAIILTEGNNVIHNNNFTVNESDSWMIRDDSSGTNTSTFIYNNSFGQIKWIDNGSGSFARNMNLSSNVTVGLNYTFFIENHSAGVNLSSFILPNSSINNSVEIRFDNVINQVTEIYKIGNYTNDSTDIIDNGLDCLGGNCTFVNFGNLKYFFNATDVGSFFANATTISNTAPNTRDYFVNASSTTNHTNDNILCWFNATDDEHSLLTAHWTWYNTTTEYTSGSTEVVNNTLVNVANITSSTTNRLDNWTCQVFAGDGVNNETDQSNSSISIVDYTCEDNISESTTLSSSITGCTANGLNIIANDLTLDCNGNTISGTGSNGLSIEHKNNLSIQDCTFANFTNGTYFRNVTNLVINNSVFFNQTEGITIYDSVNITISNNNISNTSYWGINVWDSNVTAITENYLYNLTATASSTAGIYLVRVDKGHVDSNNLTSLNSITGIVNFDDTTDMTNNSGNVTNNNITQVNNGTGLDLYSHEGENYLYSDNYIFNASVGMDLDRFDYGNITSGFFDQNTKAIRFDQFYTVDIIVKDSTFYKNTYDIQSDSGPHNNITFINSTLNRSTFSLPSGITAYVKTAVTVNVSNPSGVPISGASVEVKDVTGLIGDTQTTNSEGSSTLNALTFYHNNRINYLVSPSTFTISLNNYSLNVTTINLINDTQKELNFTINAIDCGSTVTSNLQIGDNYLCTTAGLHFIGSAFTFYGQSYNLTGENNGDGINLTSTSSMEIENLQVDNFTNGLFLHTTNHSIFRNLTIINNSYGIVFNRSNNNSIYDSILDNNSNFAVVSENDGATNNSLVNVSIEPENVSITGDASVYLRWYVDVNVTLSSGVALPNANIQAFFNDSTNLDQSATSGSDGIFRMELAEWKKNSTDVFYVTPHNISVYFTYQGVNVTNETSINLSTTNNTVVQLSLDLDCTGPSEGLQISSDTTFCPGTFTGDINVTSDDLTLTCDSTTINPSLTSSELLVIDSRDNITVDSCTWGDTTFAVQITNSTNITIENNSAYTSIFDCVNSRLITVANSTWERANFESCNESLAIGNEIGSPVTFWASFIDETYHTVFRNNTWNDSISAISVSSGTEHYNTSLYHNTLKNIGNIYVDIQGGGFVPNENYEWNTTVGGYPQGNNWEDYCDKGSDTNGDGFADAKSTGNDDWPFNGSVSTIFRPGQSINDFGPVYQVCVTEVDVATGETTTTSSSTSSTSGSSAAPSAAASSSSEAGPSASSSIYNPADTRKFLNLDSQTLAAGDITQVQVTLSNTGTKRMLLDPELFQDIDDPFFLVTTKTLGGKDSLAAKIVSIFLSPNPISGRLLKAEIVNPEQITLEPGQTLDKTIEIKSGLSVPRQIKIQFASSGETVKEQEISINTNVLTGTAVDLDTEMKTLDLYTIIVSGDKASKIQLKGPENNDPSPILKVMKKSLNNFPILGQIFGDKEKIIPETIKHSNTENTLTGGVVSDLPDEDTVYYLEINFNKGRHTEFADVYGPYYLKPDQVFIFAQQYLYEDIKGEYDIVTKVFKGQDLIIDEGFDVEFK